MDPLHETIAKAPQEDLAKVLIRILHDGRLSARDIAASLYKAPEPIAPAKKGRKRSATSGPSKAEEPVAKKARDSQSARGSASLPKPVKRKYTKRELEERASVLAREQRKLDECYRCSRKYLGKDNSETACSWHHGEYKLDRLAPVWQSVWYRRDEASKSDENDSDKDPASDSHEYDSDKNPASDSDEYGSERDLHGLEYEEPVSDFDEYDSDYDEHDLKQRYPEECVWTCCNQPLKDADAVENGVDDGCQFARHDPLAPRKQVNCRACLKRFAYEEYCESCRD